MRPELLAMTSLYLVTVAFPACPVDADSGEPCPPIPAAAEAHRETVEEAAERYHADPAPVALLAALIEQESSWQPEAVSPAGAKGLAQLTPVALEDLDRLAGFGNLDPMDPEDAIEGAAAYTAWLASQIDAEDRWAMVLAAYNGGLRALERDRRLAAKAGADPDQWWGHVADYSARPREAFLENRHYVERILKERRPRYIEAGWNAVGEIDDGAPDP